MSVSTVADQRPLRSATSSTPGTVTGPASGSDSARTSRIKVNRDTAVPSATFSSRPRNRAVRRWYQLVSRPAAQVFDVNKVQARQVRERHRQQASFPPASPCSTIDLPRPGNHEP